MEDNQSEVENQDGSEASPTASRTPEDWCARDTIAIAAMQGLIAGLSYTEIRLFSHYRGTIAPGHRQTALQAYAFADAMLAARAEVPHG